MQKVIVRICASLCFLGSAFAAEKADFIGDWDVVTEGSPEEGLVVKAVEQTSYRADGTWKSNGVFYMYLKEERQRMLTLGGPEEGKWEIKDGKLHEKTDKMQLTFFISNIEEVSKQTFEAEMPEMLEEVDAYKIVTAEKQRIVIEDEDGMKTVMTRRPVKPADKQEAEVREDPTVHEDVKEDPAGEQLRRYSKVLLDFEGFKFAQSLPTSGRRADVPGKLRPTDEISKRLMCNFVVVSWVAFPEENLPTKQVQAFVENEGIAELMTKKEMEIYTMRRPDAQAKHLDQIGWNMEAMWALAWALGYENGIDVNQGQISEKTIQELLAFVSGLTKGEKPQRRSLSEVVQLEDLFYCAHNAVRSAQTGKKECVPEGFHPILHGGIIHEKRHALTWVLSPKVDWEDTDLST